MPGSLGQGPPSLGRVTIRALLPNPHPPVHSGDRDNSLRTGLGRGTVGQGHPKDDLSPPPRNKSPLIEMTEEKFQKRKHNHAVCRGENY